MNQNPSRRSPKPKHHGKFRGNVLRTFGLQPLEQRLLLTTANNDSYNDASLVTINIPTYAGVLANDTGSGTLSAVYISGPSHGSLTFNSDGSFTYTNTSSTFMPDTFSYKAFDGTNYSSPATVSISLFGP
jgi:hypothetical protein